MNATAETEAHPTPGARPGGLAPDASAALTARVTQFSLGLAILLTLLKALAWRLSGSVALLASLGDSALDVFAAAATFFAVRYAVAPADAEHRYGHGKAEAFASLLQAGLVFASGALIGREALDHLLQPRPVEAEVFGMGVMAFSMVAVVVLVAAQNRVLKKTGSIAVHGDRAHYLADLVANGAAFAGLGAAALFKDTRFDAAAGLFVAVWLVWGAVGVFREAAHQLMDKELDDAEREVIIELAGNDPAVRGVHQLRTRASGPFIHIQMHMDLDPDLTLEAAHRIVVRAENRLLEAFPAADVLIHADPSGRAEPHGGVFGEAPYEAHEHTEANEAPH